jgi:solute carrier family 25 carnitine/acylcarnitine transporter 20/29
MATLSQQKEVIPKVAQDLIAGTVGGWAQVVVGQPLDTIKVRLQTQPSPPIYRNATDCFRQLVQIEGVSKIHAFTE